MNGSAYGSGAGRIAPHAELWPGDVLDHRQSRSIAAEGRVMRKVVLAKTSHSPGWTSIGSQKWSCMPCRVVLGVDQCWQPNAVLSGPVLVSV